MMLPVAPPHSLRCKTFRIQFSGYWVRATTIYLVAILFPQLTAVNIKESRAWTLTLRIEAGHEAFTLVNALNGNALHKVSVLLPFEWTLKIHQVDTVPYAV